MPGPSSAPYRAKRHSLAGRAECRQQANAKVRAVAREPSTPLPLRGILVAGPITLVLVLWAALAFWAVESVGETSWDGDCYAARPVWAIAQAVVALVGIGAGFRGLVGWTRGTSSVSRLFGMAIVALLVWLSLVFVLGGADAIPSGRAPRAALRMHFATHVATPSRQAR